MAQSVSWTLVSVMSDDGRDALVVHRDTTRDQLPEAPRLWSWSQSINESLEDAARRVKRVVRLALVSYLGALALISLIIYFGDIPFQQDDLETFLLISAAYAVLTFGGGFFYLFARVWWTSSTRVVGSRLGAARHKRLIHKMAQKAEVSGALALTEAPRGDGALSLSSDVNGAISDADKD